jgi:two-component system cell cycle sensor histidine kinase/response regulator CckA
MEPMPTTILDHLQAFLNERHAPAFLCAAPDLTLIRCGGDLARYGLQDLEVGNRVTGAAYFLEGILPLNGETVIVNRVETGAGSFADIHAFPADDADWVLFLDVSLEVAERTQIEEASRLSEAQREQADKMQAIGRLAGGIAHDFNNLLTVIRGYSEDVLAGLGEFEPARASVMEINSAAGRAAALTRQLMAFTRKQVIELKPIDLNAVILEMEGMLRRIVGEDVQLVTELGSNLGRVWADGGKMGQVILNLVLNARDAMPSGGTVTLRTAPGFEEEEANPGRAASDQRKRPEVVVSVIDTGAGIDEETCRHIFEPFFTTKNPEKGTGIGLTTVHGIVSQAGGRIVVDSQPGRGARFDIVFPCATAGAVETPQPFRAPVKQNDTQAALPATVLLVEDEDAIRRLVRRMLGTQGYQVLEAKSGRSALSVAAEHQGPIHLLLSDVVMPDMGGNQLAETLERLRPEIKILFMSGYPDSVLQRKVGFGGETRILQKPFTKEALLRSVRETIAATGSPGMGTSSGRKAYNA